jgi:SAM-dependent methyltransferase
MKNITPVSRRKWRFYNELAPLYDFICTSEDRMRDMEVLEKIVNRHLQSEGKKLLDVACGTGLEDKYLKRNFEVSGIDLNQGVLEIARRRNHDVTYRRGDMRTFNLEARFDVITCFDAMCYLPHYRDLRVTLTNFYRHLVPGGLLIFYLDGIFLRDHNNQDTILVNRKTRGNRTVILFEIYHKRRNRIEGHAVYTIIDGQHTRFHLDTFDILGFFDVKRIRKILADIGFKVYLYNSGDDVTFSLEKYDGRTQCPVFVCEKRQ